MYLGAEEHEAERLVSMPLPPDALLLLCRMKTT
nr:MAG TPA: hypothetical protein [Inoviridae sp.]